MAWLDSNASRSKSIVADGALLIPVSELGWHLSLETTPGYVVPHEKLDLDPDTKLLRDCDFSYVVVTEQITRDIESLGLTRLQTLLTTSVPVMDSGGIVIRKVTVPCL